MKRAGLIITTLIVITALYSCTHQEEIKISKEGVNLVSSYPSDDVENGIDGTSRLTLQSYQRANSYSFGEVTRIFLMRNNAKAMEAYYIPKNGYNEDGSANADLNPDGTIANIWQWRAVSWTGAHYGANDGKTDHLHWSVEIPDTTGALQTRFEVAFGNRITGDIGLDKTIIATNLADFNVRCGNNQELRLSAPAGNQMKIVFSHDWQGGLSGRRWVIRTNDNAEEGSNTGSDLQVIRYSDAGDYMDIPINIDRETGNVTIGGGDTAKSYKLDVRGSAIRIAESYTPESSTASGITGQICWDEDYIYICVATNTWKRMPLSSW